MRIDREGSFRKNGEKYKDFWPREIKNVRKLPATASAKSLHNAKIFLRI